MTTPGTSDPGCAVNPDGSLKDASEIDWVFDKDDEAPLVAAGSRHSGHTIRPSSCIIDPNNAMGLVGSAAAGKQKAFQKSTHNVKPKPVESSEDEDDPYHKPTDVDKSHETEDAVDMDEDEEYMSLKAMADADHKVSTLLIITCIVLIVIHPFLRQSIQSPRKTPLPTFASYSAGTKNTRTWILARSRMDTGASYVCKSLSPHCHSTWGLIDHSTMLCRDDPSIE
jgi:hypothetical protein